MLIRVELFLQVACDVLAVDRARALQPEPVVDALRVEDVLTAREHLHLIACFVRLHADCAVGVLVQLLSDLVLLRAKDLLEEA